MNQNQLPYLKIELRKEMEAQGFTLPNKLILDNQRHEYHEGSPQEWYYIAGLTEGFGKDLLTLACSYGLVNSRKVHVFSRIIRN